MSSQLTDEFIALFSTLPVEVRRKARKNYRLWKANPAHPSLDYKRVHTRRPIYSIRVGIGWRALGIDDGTDVIWFWIGPHAVYDKLLKLLS